MNSFRMNCEELFYRASGLTEEETKERINNAGIEEEVNETYGIDFDTYINIVADLFPILANLECDKMESENKNLKRVIRNVRMQVNCDN